jgi:hypothetical protein
MKPEQALGFETPADKKLTIRTGDWDAMKLHAFNSKVKWEAVEREARLLLEGCRHLDGCPATHNESVACLGLGEMQKAFAQITVNAEEETEETDDDAPPADDLSGVFDQEKKRPFLATIFGAIRRLFAPKKPALPPPTISFVHQAAPELGCPDREKRISILVILNCAREFAAIDVRKPADGRYFAPSREHFSKMVAELGAAQIEIDELRAKLGVSTKEVS